MLRILTDRGTEYGGKRECHEYQIYLAVENMDHSRTKAKSPQTKDYASHCTSSIRCDTTLFTARCDSLMPCAFRGGFSPGGSYRQSFLLL